MPDVLGAGIVMLVNTHDKLISKDAEKSERFLLEAGLPVKIKRWSYYEWSKFRVFVNLALGNLKNHGVEIKEAAKEVGKPGSATNWLLSIFRRATSMKSIYYIHYTWGGPKMFRFLNAYFKEVGEGVLELRISLKEGYEPCADFFELCVYSTPLMTEFTGHKSAQVEQFRFDDRSNFLRINLDPITPLIADSDGVNLIDEVVETNRQKLEIKSEFEKIFNSCPDPLIILKELCLRNINLAGRKMFGIPPNGNWKGSSIEKFVHPDTFRVISDWLKVKTESIVCEIYSAEQRSITVELRLGQEVVIDNEPHQVVIIRDLSNEVELNETLSRLTVFANLGALSANVSHEINSPLAVVSTNIQLLLADENIPEKSKDLLNRTFKRVLEISQTVNDTLISVKDHSNGAPETIASFLESLIKKYRGKWPGIDFEWDVGSNVDKHWKVPKSDLNNILNILVRNAVDACQVTSKPRVSISVKNSRIEVSDNGAGICDEVVPNLFSPIKSKKSRGQGLGLSLAQNFANRNSLKVVMHSQSDPTIFFLMPQN